MYYDIMCKVWAEMDKTRLYTYKHLPGGIIRLPIYKTRHLIPF
jgi:hypothetical protein